MWRIEISENYNKNKAMWPRYLSPFQEILAETAPATNLAEVGEAEDVSAGGRIHRRSRKHRSLAEIG
jgi:hypothetical protein